MDKLHRTALKRLVDEMGAEVLVTLRDRDDRGKVAIAKARHTAREGVEQCTRCDLAGKPAPMDLPLAHKVEFAVIGDKPLRGQAVNVLKSALAMAGVQRHEVALLSTVSCETLIAPTKAQASACRHHLLAQLDAAQVRYVLLLGTAGLHTWRPDLTLAMTAGRVGVWNSRWIVCPVYSPHAILRGEIVDAKEWRRQIAEFVGIVREGRELDALATDCVGCRYGMSMYDQDGMAWCELCAPMGLKKREKGTRHWKPVIDQGELL